MNAVIIYESLTGNTEKASNLMAKELQAAAISTSVCRITDIDCQALANADLVIVGTWTDGIFVDGVLAGSSGPICSENLARATLIANSPWYAG